MRPCSKIISSGSRVPVSSSARSITEQKVEQERDRKIRSISGWPLDTITRWDREGARGLLADLTAAGALTRQAAFVASANLHADGAAAFLSRLNIVESAADGIGVAIRQRRARDVIAALFAVAPEDVPTGYLRALARIEEIGSGGPGLDPFKAPDSYAALFRIFAQERHSRKAHAIRYCGALRSSTILAAERLHPLLLHADVLKVTVSPAQISAANALLDLIRSVSTMTDEEITATMRRSLGSSRCLDAFAEKALERADKLFVPYPAAEGLRPLASAAALREFGKRMGNCVGDKIGECALRMQAIYEVTERAADGTEHVLAVCLSPMIDGQWSVAEIKLAKNKHPSAELQRLVLRRFRALGALVAGPSLEGPYRSDLGSLLNAYRWGTSLDACFHEGEEGDCDAMDGLEDLLSNAA